MSRTDKDLPHWVATEWYVPVHVGCPNGGYVRYRWQRSQRGERVCDLPEVPVRSNPNRVAARRIFMDDQHCYWEAAWPQRWRYQYTWGPKKIDRHVSWWGPDRARVRDECRQARKEYRASGDVEIDVTSRHHAHAPDKGWWD